MTALAPRCFLAAKVLSGGCVSSFQMTLSQMGPSVSPPFTGEPHCRPGTWGREEVKEGGIGEGPACPMLTCLFDARRSESSKCPVPPISHVTASSPTRPLCATGTSRGCHQTISPRRMGSLSREAIGKWRQQKGACGSFSGPIVSLAPRLVSQFELQTRKPTQLCIFLPLQ